jgi:hypothetical protein
MGHDSPTIVSHVAAILLLLGISAPQIMGEIVESKETPQVSTAEVS